MNDNASCQSYQTGYPNPLMYSASTATGLSQSNFVPYGHGHAQRSYVNPNRLSIIPRIVDNDDNSLYAPSLPPASVSNANQYEQFPLNFLNIPVRPLPAYHQLVYPTSGNCGLLHLDINKSMILVCGLLRNINIDIPTDVKQLIFSHFYIGSKDLRCIKKYRFSRKPCLNGELCNNKYGHPKESNPVHPGKERNKQIEIVPLFCQWGGSCKNGANCSDSHNWWWRIYGRFPAPILYKCQFHHQPTTGCRGDPCLMHH